MLSPADILRYAQVAQATYLPGSQIPPVLERMGLHAIDASSVGDWLVLACRSSDELLISFRGTADFANLLADADDHLVPFVNRLAERPCIHEGFLFYWQACAWWVRRMMELHPGLRVTFVCHSAGAGPAHYGACMLWPQQVVSFGSPRLGDEAWPRVYGAYRIPTTRVVHNADIVPSLPCGDPWRHVCTPYILGAASYLDRGVLAVLDGDALRDHHIDGYLTAAQADLTRRKVPA